MQEHTSTVFNCAVVNATRAVTMLEYNWYGQVSEADTPTLAFRCKHSVNVCIRTWVIRPQICLSQIIINACMK